MLRTPSGVRAEQHRLEPHHRPVARRQVRDRLDVRVARSIVAGDHQRAHACARGRVVVDVDPADEP